MKKLFICVMTSLCSTFAFADADLVVKQATITNGNGTMQVVINKAGQTAFQFDVKLPTGVSVSAFETATGDRKFEKNQVDASTNKWRFLSYDEKNATLAAGTTFNISLAAAEGAEDGEAETGEILLVDPEGNGTDVGGSTTNITVSESVEITVPAGKKLMMVSNKALDFTSLESKGVKAYICTGYELVGTTNRFWLTRVDDVPANTPIMVKADAGGTYQVPKGASNYCYPKSFLSGDATNLTTVDYTADFKYFGVSQSTGNIGAMSQAKQPTVEAGKAFFQVPATIVSKVADGKQEFTLGDGGRLATVSDYDLDFTEVEAQGVKAYTVMGFDKNRKVWMTPVSNVNAGTPFVLRGSKGQKCEVPSVAGKAAYVNMLDANTGEDPVTVSPTIGENTVYVLSLGKGTWGTLSKDWSAVKGKAWMLVPTSFHNSLPAASTRGFVPEITEQEAEVICIEVKGNSNLGDDDTTDIRAIDEVQSDDAWYNLKGQRIDTPTKKGLYIKNGKKVVVK